MATIRVVGAGFLRRALEEARPRMTAALREALERALRQKPVEVDPFTQRAVEQFNAVVEKTKAGEVPSRARRRRPRPRKQAAKRRRGA